MSSAFWCFTLNNPTEEDDNHLNPYHPHWQEQLDLLLYSPETGKEGTFHLQGYLELRRHKPLQWLRKKLPRAHFERRKGSKNAAMRYCLKEFTKRSPDCSPIGDASATRWDEPFYWLSGDLLASWRDLVAEYSSNPCTNASNSKAHSRKETLQTMKTMIEDQMSNIALANYDFSTFVHCFRGLNYYRLLITKPRNHAMEILVLQGPTGTGKSRWAHDNYPNAYWKQNSQWWDNYNNEPVVVIDEYYGWLRWDYLLRLTDRYPFMVETKHGQVQFNSKTIIFTTNSLPTSWYKNMYMPAFERRVSEWHVFPVWGEHQTYTSTSEAYAAMSINTAPCFNFPV